MTSMAGESVATIQVAAKQTRFKIQKPDYREVSVSSVYSCYGIQTIERLKLIYNWQLDVQDLDMRIISSEKTAKGKTKIKSKGESAGHEILAGANLKLKGGQRYALLGRNGSGKSSMYRYSTTDFFNTGQLYWI